MAIAPLPESTIRILGSAQVLTSPVSLVKELIDNALDAKATSIDVTIDSSTLRKIEVRDNGHGVAEQDLDVLGKRGHTSKLKSLADLRIVGSTSLGFRGEALASAMELGEVTVTTKTDGQTTATVVKLQAKGDVVSRKPASHPVGTTISVSNFLERLTVRKKRALVDASKTLSKIKELLQAYALARLTVRFSLKVIQVDVQKKTMRSGRGNWSFVPRPSGSVKEVVTQVMGKDVAAECMETSIAFPLGEDVYTPDNRDIELEAFLAKPHADFAKLAKGQFVSIDSRPVICTRGTLKKIVALYKDYLRSAISKSNNHTAQIKDPFLRLNIVCRPGVYDPNVEPAKDDVLFANEPYLIECVEQLLTAVYGELHVAVCPSNKQAAQNDGGFERLLARKSDPAPSQEISRAGECPKGGNDKSNTEYVEDIVSDENENEVVGDGDFGNLPVQRGDWGFSMAKDYDDASAVAPTPASRDHSSAPDYSDLEIMEEQPDPKSLNPWAIAKLNATTRDGSAITSQSKVPGTTTTQDFPSLISRNEQSFFPTPDPTSEPMFVPTSPETPAQQREMGSGFMVARDLPLGRPWSPPPALEPRPKRRRSFNTPFKSPLHRSKDLTLEHKSQDVLSFSDDIGPGAGHSLSVNPTLPIFSDNTSGPTMRQTTLHTDLQDSLAFERRKEEATRERREGNRAAHKAAKSVQRTDNPAPHSSPHQNRYNAATAVLDAIRNPMGDEQSVADKESFKTSLPDGDPRAYLMRRQRSLQARARPGSVLKMKRAKSTMLPLETVPERVMMQNVELRIETEMERMGQLMVELSATDCYTKGGFHDGGGRITQQEASGIQERLKHVVGPWLVKKFGSAEMEIQYDTDCLMRVRG